MNFNIGSFKDAFSKSKNPESSTNANDDLIQREEANKFIDVIIKKSFRRKDFDSSSKADQDRLLSLVTQMHATHDRSFDENTLQTVLDERYPDAGFNYTASHARRVNALDLMKGVR